MDQNMCVCVCECMRMCVQKVWNGAKDECTKRGKEWTVIAHLSKISLQNRSLFETQLSGHFDDPLILLLACVVSGQWTSYLSFILSRWLARSLFLGDIEHTITEYTTIWMRTCIDTRRGVQACRGSERAQSRPIMVGQHIATLLSNVHDRLPFHSGCHCCWLHRINIDNHLSNRPKPTNIADCEITRCFRRVMSMSSYKTTESAPSFVENGKKWKLGPNMASSYIFFWMESNVFYHFLGKVQWVIDHWNHGGMK